MLTREQNLHNQETLYHLLAKHFCYDKKTLATLKDEIENRTVDPVYKNLGLDEFGRKYCPIEGYGSEKSDESWVNFKNIFGDFVSAHKVTYQNYLDNRIVVEKNNYRLIKAMSTYYTGVKVPTANMLKKSSEIRWNFNNGYTLGDAVLITLNKILEKRKSRKVVQAVISVNPVDIFLCSTANSWSTCYSCENSMMTYIGIPGLFFDFNRSIVFITDGNKSTYLGLYKDKSLCRAWALLDDNDNYVNVEGFYPWGAYQKMNFAQVFNYDRIRSTAGDDHRKAFAAKHRIETYLPHNFAKDTKIVFYPHLDYNTMTYDKLIRLLQDRWRIWRNQFL